MTTSRKPLVIVSGLQQELPAGDNIAASVLAALGQVEGFTTANVLEVEAATKAMRAVLNRQADAIGALGVSHHSIGIHCSHSASAAWATDSQVVTLGNLSPMYAFIKRIDVSVGCSAVTGGSVGTGRISLYSLDPLIAMGSSGGWVSPPVNLIEAGVSTGGPNYSSLKNQQERPKLIIQSCGIGSTPAGTTASGVLTTSKGLGEIAGGFKNAIGVVIPPTNLFDHMNTGHPIVLDPNTGLVIASNFPSPAASTQTIQYSVNIQWSEWQILTPF